MASYIHSTWKNAPPDSPVEFFSELDAHRYETRKIEIYANGRVGFASKSSSALDTRLSIEPIPSVAEIRIQPEFSVREIPKDEFEQKWKAVGAR